MRKILLWIVAALVAVALILTGIGWYFSGLVLAVKHNKPYDIPIVGITKSTITLPLNSSTKQPGTYGLTLAGGDNVVVGAIDASTDKTVTRELISRSGAPAAGQKGRWNYNVWNGDPKSALGLDFDNVDIPAPLGAMPAWYVPARSSTWVIAIHGRDESHHEALRAMPALHAGGLPVLAISYRNDIGAPASPDHRDHLGSTEWRDVDAAIHYATSRGAQHFVLYGWSMGGAIAMETLHDSSDSALVSAVILDDPVMNWQATLDHQGATRNLPLPVSRVAEQIYAWRANFSFAAFDQVRRASSVKVPVMIFHGSADNYVPAAPTYAYARKNAATTTLLLTPRAKHTGSWNVDQARYDGALSQFIDSQNFPAF